ncbi:hypothetical protein ACFYKT_14495 [Cytobacillus sp. FJAT-53684]|uniref:Lipoprotein n=1 Tax=Cytobacillus mangrovibacter TaxID=3299024 RepID=A0ABW6K088_9BACI
MNKPILSLMLVVSLFYLSSCVDLETKTSVSKHPDAEEVLRLDDNADILQWDGLIYKTDIVWVNELELTKKECIGEISELFTDKDTKSFNNGMANKLPIGSKIYTTNEIEGILIVEYNGKKKYYLSQVEG